jgi:hypothetical protein
VILDGTGYQDFPSAKFVENTRSRWIGPNPKIISDVPSMALLYSLSKDRILL